MSLKEIVGMNLKYYRYKAGLSQEKFYSNLGLSYKYMAAVERGEENITSEKIDEYAYLMGVNIRDLVNYDASHVVTKRRVDERKKVNS